MRFENTNFLKATLNDCYFMINCSLILYVQPRGQKHGLRSSSNSPSLFFFFFFFFWPVLYIYVEGGMCCQVGRAT
jgi:hypothetical protein